MDFGIPSKQITKPEATFLSDRLNQEEQKILESSSVANCAVVIQRKRTCGLAAKSEPAHRPHFKVEPDDFGFIPGIDLDRLNQLGDELEAEEASRPLAR